MVKLYDRWLRNSAAVAAICLAAVPVAARADEVLDNVLRRLDKLERENAALKAQVAKQAAKRKTEDATAATITSTAPPPRPVQVQQVQLPGLASDDGWYLHKKDGAPLTFQTPGGEFTVYGRFDVSVDAATKGIRSKSSVNGDPPAFNTPVGNVGWLPAISSNLSYVGVRGFQKIMDSDFKFVYQLETLIDVAVQSGVRESNSNNTNTVSGALTTRDSFIGLSDTKLGSLKVGKEQAPYKKSTDAFNPFNGMLGDYRVIMGNTGGDNRVEFAAFLEHSIWWESPDWNGFKLAALFSPGQNRANNSDNIASGSSDCAGGNNPSSGGFSSCSDGAFSNAISVSATYKKDGFLITTAYERHEKVNRESDLPTYVPAGFQGAGAFTNPDSGDVAAEDAFKVGALYKVKETGTTFGGIWETLHRYVPARLAYQNERTRDGTWGFLTQELGPKDEVSFGWAHAFGTPGDPGQHNTSGGPNPRNQADMVTGVYKHSFNTALLGYVNWASTFNQRDAHFDLGAGGHGVTTDCHDASDATGGATSNPHCWAGGTLHGVSVGMQYKF